MARLTQIRANVVSLVDRAAVRDPSNPTEPQRFLLWKSENHRSTGGAMPTIEEVTASLEKAEQEKQAALAKQAELEATIADLEKAAAAADDNEGDDEDDIEKALAKSDLPESVRTILRKQADERTEAIKKAEEAEKIAKAERDTRLTSEAIAKAETEFPNVGGDPRKFGPLLKTASEKLEKAEFDQLETLLKAAEEQIRKGALFSELGKSGEFTPEQRDEVTKTEQRAEELRKADPKLAKHEALAQAIREERANS